nr:MAG TPA: hypothetical protein [Caudoviricetes sp.]
MISSIICTICKRVKGSWMLQHNSDTIFRRRASRLLRFRTLIIALR